MDDIDTDELPFDALPYDHDQLYPLRKLGHQLGRLATPRTWAPLKREGVPPTIQELHRLKLEYPGREGLGVVPSIAAIGSLVDPKSPLDLAKPAYDPRPLEGDADARIADGWLLVSYLGPNKPMRRAARLFSISTLAIAARNLDPQWDGLESPAELAAEAARERTRAGDAEKALLILERSFATADVAAIRSLVDRSESRASELENRARRRRDHGCPPVPERVDRSWKMNRPLQLWTTQRRRQWWSPIARGLWDDGWEATEIAELIETAAYGGPDRAGFAFPLCPAFHAGRSIQKIANWVKTEIVRSSDDK